MSEPHIAVILPLQSSSYGKHADSVRLGILNAAGNGQPGSLKVRVYGTSEDPQQILSAYQRAISLGARAVIGPLTRNGVTSLAQSGLVSVPTLALNTPDWVAVTVSDQTLTVLRSARRGLAVERCDASLITNVTNDHLGSWRSTRCATAEPRSSSLRETHPWEDA